MKVLVADDDYIFRSFMRRILGTQPDLAMVGDAIDADEAVRRSRQLEPDVVLVSIHLPRGDGLEATRRIKAEHPRVRVFITAEIGGPAYKDAAARAGADGFLVKDSEISQILSAIRRGSAWDVRTIGCG